MLPSDVNLAGAEIELLDVPNKEIFAENRAGKDRRDYDYIIIDCHHPELAYNQCADGGGYGSGTDPV